MSYSISPYQRANVRREPNTKSEILSFVVADENYPAECWTYGEKITDNGVTNNVWVEMFLKSGRVGYVSAVYLRGDNYGGLPESAQCFQGP